MMRLCPHCGGAIGRRCSSGHLHDTVLAARDCDLLKEFRAVVRAVQDGRLPMKIAYLTRKYSDACRTTSGKENIHYHSRGLPEPEDEVIRRAAREQAFIPDGVL